jgi:uncharacterized membrane protein
LNGGSILSMTETQRGVRTMSSLVVTLTVLCMLGAALVAGVFYAFSGFVMPALARMPAAQGMAAMQSINVTAVRAPLMLAMFGTALVSVVLAVVAVRGWGQSHAIPLLAGSVLYLLGSIVMTMVFHVPMNDALAVLDPTAASSVAPWTDYLSRWSAGNQVRWVVPLAASACYSWAVLR